MRRIAESGVRLSLFVGLMWAGTAMAEPWQHAVAIRYATEYDDNPAMAAVAPTGIGRMVLDPAYRITRTSGLNELKAGVAVHVARSSNRNLSQDRADPTVFFNWHGSADKRELEVAMRHDKVATRAAEYGGFGTHYTDATRASSAASMAANMSVGERSMLVLNGTYMNVAYHGGSYVDYVSRSAGMAYNYVWSERGGPFVEFSYDDLLPANGGRVSRRQNNLLGLKWKFSDVLEGIARAGWCEIDQTSRQNRKLASIAVQYSGQVSKLLLNADRQVVASGLGGFIAADHAKGGWEFAISERSKAGIDLDWWKNRSTANNSMRTLGVWLEHEMGPRWGLRGYYLRKVGLSGTSAVASSNILGVSLVYTTPN